MGGTLCYATSTPFKAHPVQPNSFVAAGGSCAAPTWALPAAPGRRKTFAVWQQFSWLTPGPQTLLTADPHTPLPDSRCPSHAPQPEPLLCPPWASPAWCPPWVSVASPSRLSMVPGSPHSAAPPQSQSLGEGPSGSPHAPEKCKCPGRGNGSGLRGVAKTLVTGHRVNKGDGPSVGPSGSGAPQTHLMGLFFG